MEGTSEPEITIFNARLVLPSSAVPVLGSLSFRRRTGFITRVLPARKGVPDPEENVATETRINLHGQILAPGFLDLQTNGMAGVHFTTLASKSHTDQGEDDVARLQKCARLLVSSGTTAFWATIPTVPQERWREILPSLQAREFLNAKGTPEGATLLGAHCEGPYLAPEKKGAHAAEYMLLPAGDFPRSASEADTAAQHEVRFVHHEDLYGSINLADTVKMITIAPELPNALDMIASLRQKHPHIRIAIGHTTATYAQASAAVAAGATMVTHTFNAMNGCTGREPGVAGLMLEEERRVYYSTIADGVHLHPLTLSLAIRSGLDRDGLGGGRCIGITDAIELAGLPDGTYEGNEQIVGRQVKVGNKVVKEGTGTLIGSCVLLDSVVREMVKSAPDIRRVKLETSSREAEERKLVIAVKAVGQNVADMMGEGQRGRLEVGRRADFAVLNHDNFEGDGGIVVTETWVGGWKVFDRGEAHTIGADDCRDESGKG
jgi:N-acetylglucosamine-6-phosphate deacetylase